jgi:uncharacterized protein (DUF2235 family)
MSRNLIVCCDGTWNEPDEPRHGVPEPTNVAKLALSVATENSEPQQHLLYEPGVGTTPSERLSGGAFGYGLSRNIRNCYRFLAREYQAGDRLFLFGFSRGAYTARSLAGLIRNCGILRSDDADMVDAAYAFYRDRTDRTKPSTIASAMFRKSYSHPLEPIHFIGVWDTVGALGIPVDFPGWHQMSQVFTGWERMWGFHDTTLSSQVTNAIHALSIDEQRAAFKPTLWTRSDNAAPGDQNVKQVWFSGVHSEVGGGTDNNALSDITLLWMAEQARLAGLVFEGGQPGAGWEELSVPRAAPDYAGELHNSRHGLFRLAGAYDRLAQPYDEKELEQAMSSTAARRVADVQDYSPPGYARYLAALGGTLLDVEAP